MRWTAPLLAAALAVAACGDDDDGPAADDTVATSGTTASNGTGAMVAVGDLGVSFEAPDGWTAIDPQDVGDVTDDAVIEELAERTGVSAEALRNTMDERVELFVFSGETEGEIASNINAVGVPIADVPAAEAVEEDFGELGATNVMVEPADAAGNDALVVRYRLPLEGGRVVEGYGLFVDVGDEVVNLTVTAFSREEADRVGELIRSTVTPDG